MENTKEFIQTFKEGWEFMNKVEKAVGLSLHELPIGDALGKLFDLYITEKFGEGFPYDEILPIEDHGIDEIMAVIKDRYSDDK